MTAHPPLGGDENHGEHGEVDGDTILLPVFAVVLTVPLQLLEKIAPPNEDGGCHGNGGA